MAHFRRLCRFLKRYEPVLFCAVVVLNLIPILSVKYFPTVDGPAHLYNAKLIIELLSGDSSWNEFIGFNGSFTPNWTGHLLFFLLLKLFSTSIAEKVILGIYLVGVPLLVKQLLSQLRAPSLVLVYLIFPFLYSYLFHFGFFNYHLAIVFFFAGLVAWLRALNSGSNRDWVLVAVLAFLVSMSHPFVFGLFTVVSSTLTVGRVASSNSAFGSVIRPFLVLLPGIVTTGFFLLNSDSITQTTSRIPWQDLLISFKYIMPIKGLNMELYHIPSKVLLYLFSGLVIVALAGRVIPSNGSNSARNEWWGVAVFTGLLVFIFPDYLGDAGLISSRLMWFSFIFLIIALALVEFPKIIRSLVFFVALSLTVWSVNHNFTQIKPASNLAAEVVELSESIEPGSTVLPITNFGNRQFTRVAHYVGLQNNILLLRNYEAELSYFPLVWNYDGLPKFRLGLVGPTDCVGWVEGAREARTIDYLIWVSDLDGGTQSECMEVIKTDLANQYEIIEQSKSGRAKLYAKHS